MADKISGSQIFLFLAKQDDWKTKADLNNDKEITKGEMREYLGSTEFSEATGVNIADVSATEFNKFWLKLDSIAQNNRMGADELAKADITIGNYQKLEELISAKEAEVSGIIDQNHIGTWNGKMAELLVGVVDNYDENCGQTIDALLQEALQPAFCRATAETLADQFRSPQVSQRMYSGLSGLNYDIAADKDLTEIINNYIEQKILAPTDKPWTAGDIEKQIKAVISSYLKEAGITNEGGNIDLSEYGYNSAKLNDAQKASLTKKITDSLAGDKAKFAGYEKEYDSALSKFIDNWIKTSGTTAAEGQSLYATIAAKIGEIANEFKQSADYKKLEVTVEVFSKYRDNASDEFKQAIRNALGEDAEGFLEFIKENTTYNSKLQTIIDRISGGDETLLNADKSVNWSKVQEAVINAIKSIVLGAIGGTGELDALQTDYENNKKDLEKAKEKAIAYCDAAKALGGDYAKAVTTVFGSDHKGTINGYDGSEGKGAYELSVKMNQLFALIAKIVDVSKLAVTKWNSDTTLNNKTLKAGQVLDNIDASVETNIPNADRSLFEYSVTGTSGGEASINSSTGKLKLKAGDQEGFLVTTIVVQYDGKTIGTKKITIDVTPNYSTIAGVANWANGADRTGLPGGNGSFSDGDGGLRLWGGSGAYNDWTLNGTDISFADLYNGNYNIELGTSAHSDGNKYSTDICNRLYNLGYAVVNALAGQGLDKDKLNTAMQTVTQQWSSNITDAGKLASKGCNKSSQRKDSCGTYVKLSNGFTNGSYSGITRGQDEKGNDQKVYMINFRQYVDAILDAYYS